MLISYLFQQFYNMVDIVVVGHFLGEDSLSAIGACTAVFDLLIGFGNGFGNGLGIVAASFAVIGAIVYYFAFMR